MNRIDGSIVHYMQYQLSNPVLDRIMKYITYLGDYCLIWIVVTLLFYFTGKTRVAGWLIITMLVTNAINNGLIKAVFRRKRPFEEYDDITIEIDEPYGSSFPSGHSATSFCCATMVFAYSTAFGLISYVVASLIAFSRMYLRVHYFSDVLVGCIVGILCSAFLIVRFGLF